MGAALVHQVVEGMRRECAETDRLDVWTVFEKRILAEIFHDAQPSSYQSLAEELTLQSPSQAANLLVTAKRMYARLLRAAVAEYEPSDEAIEEEIAALRKALGTSPFDPPLEPLA